MPLCTAVWDTLGGAENMTSSASFSYGESVISHLEQVRKLPARVQAEIAARVDNCIKIAAKDEAILEQLAHFAMEGASQGNWTGGHYDGPVMGCTGDHRGMVLCQD